MYPTSQQRPTLLPLPQLLIPSAYPNTASHIPVTYTSPSLPPLPDEKTYGQLLAEQEAIEGARQKDKDERERLKQEREVQEDRRREVEERRLREEEERRETIVRRREDKKREEKEKRRRERHERRERRQREAHDRLKRKHTPRPGTEQPKEDESKQQLSTDGRWGELVRELSGSREEREEKRKRAEEKRASLWSRKGDEVADGVVEAVTDSDTDSLSSMGGRPIEMRDIASSSSSDAIDSRSKRNPREAIWPHPARHVPVPVRHRRRRQEAFAPPYGSNAVFADDFPPRNHGYETRSRSAEPPLLWSQATPPRTPRASQQDGTSDSLWSTPPPQLQLHSRPRAAFYTPQLQRSSGGLYDAPSHARLLELPDTLLHPPGGYEAAMPQFVPLRSSGTTIELSSEEEAVEEEDEVLVAMHAQSQRRRVKAQSARGGDVRERWVNLLDEERLAVFSGLQYDGRPDSAQQFTAQQPRAFTARTKQPARGSAAPASEAGVGVEDGELQDDELLQKARELNYHALLLKKKRAGNAPVFASLSNTPDSGGRKLAVSAAVEQKVEAEMAKLRQRVDQQTNCAVKQVVAAPAPRPTQPVSQLLSRPLSPPAPLRDERTRARSAEQQRLHDKLAAIERKLAESPPPPVRRADNFSREDEARRRRQQVEQQQHQRQEAEARDLTHRLHTILLSPPSASATPRALTPPPTIPLVSVHPALKPVPLPPQAREKLALLKGKQQGRGKLSSRTGGKSGADLDEKELYGEAQALIAAFRTEFGGAMKAHTQNL